MILDHSVTFINEIYGTFENTTEKKIKRRKIHSNNRNNVTKSSVLSLNTLLYLGFFALHKNILNRLSFADFAVLLLYFLHIRKLKTSLAIKVIFVLFKSLKK